MSWAWAGACITPRTLDSHRGATAAREAPVTRQRSQRGDLPVRRRRRHDMSVAAHFFPNRQLVWT